MLVPASLAERVAARHAHESHVAAAVAEDPRPLVGYAALLAVYGTVTGLSTLALRRKRRDLPTVTVKEVALMGLATAHLSRLVTKDSVTSVLRVPFTRFEEPAGEGEVNEEVIGHGLRHAVGELITCPFCAAQWIATALVVGRVAVPNLTSAVVTVSAVARVSDFLQLLYGLAREAQE
ncbi:MAG TPA: DUF1360 domain-containing protein [Acidimicrobiales bacterium]|nr:DUF1360 domain-containing protein [Acidimicrobiales bacterium]